MCTLPPVQGKTGVDMEQGTASGNGRPARPGRRSGSHKGRQVTVVHLCKYSLAAASMHPKPSFAARFLHPTYTLASTPLHHASSLRKGHANDLCIVPALTDVTIKHILAAVSMHLNSHWFAIKQGTSSCSSGMPLPLCISAMHDTQCPWTLHCCSLVG